MIRVFLTVLGGLLSMVGIVLLIVMFFGGGSTTPLLVAAGLGLLFLSVGLVIPPPSDGLGKEQFRGAALLAVLTLMVVAALWMASFSNPDETKAYSMTWQFGDRAGCQGEPHVVLRFKRFPNHRLGYCSRQLAEHLKSFPMDEVTVFFEVRRRFGSVVGHRLVQIGGKAEWDFTETYEEIKGEGPSAWSEP